MDVLYLFCLSWCTNLRRKWNKKGLQPFFRHNKQCICSPPCADVTAGLLCLVCSSPFLLLYVKYPLAHAHRHGGFLRFMHVSWLGYPCTACLPGINSYQWLLWQNSFLTVAGPCRILTCFHLSFLPIRPQTPCSPLFLPVLPNVAYEEHKSLWSLLNLFVFSVYMHIICTLRLFVYAICRIGFADKHPHIFPHFDVLVKRQIRNKQL